MTAAKLAVEARKLAEFLGSYPLDVELPTHVDVLTGAEVKWLIFGDGETQKARAAAIVKTFGGHWDKEYDTYARFKSVHSSGVKLRITVDRAKVCRRIVTASEEVTKTVPDPNAPMVEVTETVETVEWVCDEPLLAEVSS